MPTTIKEEIIDVNAAEDVSIVRQHVRALAVEVGLSLVDQTKLITAASELARNIVVHGGGSGTVRLEMVENPNVSRRGVRLTFQDQGPGIPDIERALQDGYTTGGGLGLGLGGSRRLVHDFELVSAPDEGTSITVTRWKS